MEIFKLINEQLMKLKGKLVLCFHIFNTFQCSKLAVVRSSETTKKFIGQPILGKIKRLVAQGKINGQPSQK